MRGERCLDPKMEFRHKFAHMCAYGPLISKTLRARSDKVRRTQEQKGDGVKRGNRGIVTAFEGPKDCLTAPRSSASFRRTLKAESEPAQDPFCLRVTKGLHPRGKVAALS